MLQLHWLANVELRAGRGEKDTENGKALELKIVGKQEIRIYSFCEKKSNVKSITRVGQNKNSVPEYATKS